MKIAVTSQGQYPESPVNPRFGRAQFFMVFDTVDKTYKTFDNKQNLQSGQGAGIQAAATVVNAGCGVLVTGHCGPKAFTALQKAGVDVYTTRDMRVKDAVESFLAGKLTKLSDADVDGHW